MVDGRPGSVGYIKEPAVIFRFTLLLPSASSSSSASCLCVLLFPVAVPEIMSKRAEGTRGAKGTTQEPSAARMTGRWERSSFEVADLEALVADGLVLRDAARIPGEEEVPAPRVDERVCFQSFFPRGFSLPLHPFVRGLLFAYHLQLHDLTPNGILHIACFITLCECFLGIYPHWGLWKRLFNVKRTNSEYAIGGVGISIKDKNAYFDLEKLDSIHTWRRGWFYLKDQTVAGQQYGLAPFDSVARVTKQSSWGHVLSAAEVAAVEPLVRALADLRGKITGGQLIAVFMRRRIQPLQYRVHPMWQYSGLEDLTRCSPVDVSGSDLLFRIQQITKCTSMGLVSSVFPYAADVPLPEVFSSCLCRCSYVQSTVC